METSDLCSRKDSCVHTFPGHYPKCYLTSSYLELSLLSPQIIGKTFLIPLEILSATQPSLATFRVLEAGIQEFSQAGTSLVSCSMPDTLFPCQHLSFLDPQCTSQIQRLDSYYIGSWGPSSGKRQRLNPSGGAHGCQRGET